MLKMFNDSKLKDKIVNGSIGFPSPIEEGGPDVACFILGDSTFALKP